MYVLQESACIHILPYLCRNNLSTSFKMIIFLYCLKASVRALLCVALSHARVALQEYEDKEQRGIIPVYEYNITICALTSYCHPHTYEMRWIRNRSSHREQLHHGDSINSNSRACDAISLQEEIECEE